MISNEVSIRMQATAIVPAVQKLRGQAPKEPKPRTKKAAGKRKASDDSSEDAQGDISGHETINTPTIIHAPTWSKLFDCGNCCKISERHCNLGLV